MNTNIIDAVVDWAHGYANSPTLHLKFKNGTVPEFTPHDSIWTYEADTGMVWAEKEDIIAFAFIGNGVREETGSFRGYGGRHFAYTLTNNTVMVTNDCWSGNAGNLPFEAVDVYVGDDTNGWTIKAIRIENFRNIIAELGFHIVPDYRNRLQEISTRPDESCKEPMKNDSFHDLLNSIKDENSTIQEADIAPYNSIVSAFEAFRNRLERH